MNSIKASYKNPLSVDRGTFRIKRGIRFKLMLATLSLTFGLLLVFTGIQIFIQQQIARENLESRTAFMKQNLIQQGQILSKVLVAEIKNEIAAFNFSNVNLIIENSMKQSDTLAYAILTNTEGFAYVDTEKPELQQTKLTSPIDLFALQQQIPTFKEVPAKHVIEYITPIVFGSPWGVLRLGFSLKGLEQEISRSESEMNHRADQILATSLIIALVFILIAAILVLLISTALSKPIMYLAKFSQDLGKGNFDKTIQSYQKNHLIDMDTEHGLLAHSLIEMAYAVKKSNEALEEYNRSLEDSVKQRTEKLVQSEKMAALGHLISGIAHEINTPLGAIGSSASTMQKLLSQTLLTMPSLFQTLSNSQCESFVSLLNRSLLSNNCLISAKEQRQKRLALETEIKHEFDDAYTVADTLVDMGIHDNVADFLPILKGDKGSQLLKMAYQLSELTKGTQTINLAMERVAKVVFALKSYVHEDNSGEKTRANIIDGLETIITLYQSQIKHGIQLIRLYADQIPTILCYPDELNQVWTNLIHNALQAMDYEGTLTISVQFSNDQIAVEIQDSGIGIQPENLDKIFEAFYTTKAAGEGSGLGLHIIKKIIDKHSGSINVSSRPGETIFTVKLPALSQN